VGSMAYVKYHSDNIFSMPLGDDQNNENLTNRLNANISSGILQKIDLVTNSLSRPYFESALQKLSKINEINANLNEQ
jgi:hypothetical protein